MATNKMKKEDETMKHPVKRSLAILLALAILAGLCILPASAASFPSSLYLRQITNVSCTRASNTMMCRARAYLSGNDNWSSITEYDLTNCGAWSDSYGMSWNYTLSKPGDGIHSISVSETAVRGLSLGTVKALLNAHPEGFVMYCGRLPHAIFITDYAGDTIYCADPGWGYSGNRRPLTSSYFGTCYGSQANILANVTTYWYVAGYNISSSGNAPTGWLDSVTSDSVGRIHVKGWTLDADSPTTSLDVHVYIGGAAGDSNAEGHVIKANLERSDIAAAYPGAGSAHGFDAVINTSKSGNQPVYVYGINVGAGGNALLNNSGARVNIIADTAAPTINDVKVSNVSGRGYTVTCKVSDNVGVTKVTMPTWTVKNGQDDLVWHTATISGNTATSHVSIGDHNLESGNYLTHIYAYDAAGNSSAVPLSAITVPNILSGPTASGTLKDGVYTIASSLNRNLVLDVAEMSKNSGANIQVWTAANSENQLWYIKSLGSGLYSVRALHSGRYINVAGSGKANGTNLQQWNNDTPNGDEKWRIQDNGDGTYTFIAAVNGLALDLANGKAANGQNVQCWQTNGSGAQKWLLIPSSVQEDFYGPSISNIQVTEVSTKGYRVTCTVTDPSGVAKVTMPTWSVKNNQDDIVWHEAAISGNTATFYVRVSDHNDEAGDYLTHIYATDKRGYLSSTSAGTIHVPEDKQGPEISNVRISEVTPNGYRVTCTVTDETGVARVKMPTWSDRNGQDDLVWHEATLNGNTATFYVRTADHKSETGSYTTHIYADDTRGNNSSTAAPTIHVPFGVPDGYYRLASAVDNSKGLDIAGVSTDNGANAHLWAYGGGSNQKFELKYQNGYYTLMALHSGKYIDVVNGSNVAGTNVQQYQGNGSDAQQWMLKDAGDGYAYVVNKSGLYLDVNGTFSDNGTNVQVWTGNGSVAQKWKLIPVEKEVRKGYDAGYTGGMAGSGSIVAYGIDVSEHQGTGFNFQNLKNSGYSYVILRCGFVTRKDYRFEEYYAAAKAAGLNVGVYFYSYASTPAEASYEADRCLSYIQGKKFEYPVYFDFEDGSARSYNGALAQQICNAFLSKIDAAGYLPGLYGYASWLDPNYGAWVPTSSICSKWECWMANYYNGSPVNVKSANYPSTYGMYQYTSSNYVNGVGPLDTNVCYKDYPYIVKTYHFNGY